MTRVKSKIVFMAILMMALTVSMAQATWEVEQIVSGPDDGFITETGVKWFDTTWIELKNRAISLSSYYAFRSVTIPDNVTILNAYLQFTAPSPFTFPAAESLDVTIYGLKTGDLTSWDPTPDLESEPFTTTFTNFDVTNMSAGIKINVTILAQVQEIYGMNAWTDGNDMGFRVVSVAVDDHLATRYQESFDNSPLDSMKMYIEYTESNATTTYYKGYTISSTAVGTGAVLTWSSTETPAFSLTTADVLDYLTVSTYQTHSIFAPDTAVSVGTDIYMVWLHPVDPYNSSLRKTTDRGLTWTTVGEIEPDPQTIFTAKTTAIAYDLVDSIYIAYNSGFDSDVKIFTISNQSMSTGFTVFEGGFNAGEHRAYWDQANDMIWFTRYGGDPEASSQRPNIIRRFNGSWETYRLELADYRVSDVTWADGKMYWVINQWHTLDSQKFLRLFRMDNFSDITNWTQVGGTVGSLNNFVPNSMDIGTYEDDPVISMLVTIGSWDYIYQNRWLGGSWSTNLFNLTPSIGLYNFEFHQQKMYYQGDGELWMAVIVQRRDLAAYKIIYNDWAYYLSIRNRPGVTQIAFSNDEMSGMGGSMFPFTSGISVFTVFDENGTQVNSTCLDAAVTIEDVEACIDSIDGVGQTPDDPNPPGSEWAEDGFGELTRFNMRFVMFLVGWFLIIAPLIIMVVRPWPMKVYLVFVICIALGFALQWSIGSI